MVLFVLPSILLVVVIVVTVVIVVVISVVVVVAIVGVVIVVIGSSVSSINKLSLVFVGSFSCYWSSTCLGVPISVVSIFYVSSLCFQSSSNAISYQLPDGSLSHNWCCEYSSDEDGGTGMGDSTGVSVSLGEVSLEGNKSWELNIGDSDNTGDGGKIAGRALTTWGGGMVSYACMTSIFESSCKGKKTSMSKRYLVKSFEESGEMLPDEA
uniref:Uncharacterized protein n=1 Tax=Tanacetum cinerariifolium TaxID=118510 RepID=A0A6L2JTQ1_TANCI|nr:hypothetical protein [Tanacetum cinerariifolium]